jgi:hypothetical protein
MNPTLEQDLAREKLRIEDLLARARRRVEDCRRERTAAQARGRSLAGAAAAAPPGGTKESGPTTAPAASPGGAAEEAAECERRVRKLTSLEQRYADLVHELAGPGDLLAAEVLLARLQGPELDLLVGEVERSRETLVQHATDLLRSRDQHRALRQRWGELNEKVRRLCEYRNLPPPRTAVVDFKVTVTPANWSSQSPDGPTYREVGDLLREIGL